MRKPQNLRRVPIVKHEDHHPPLHPIVLANIALIPPPGPALVGGQAPAHLHQPLDPHSAVQTNFVYGFVGWTMSHKEEAIDASFVSALSCFPELRILVGLWAVSPLTLNAALCHFLSPHAMICLGIAALAC